MHKNPFCFKFVISENNNGIIDSQSEKKKTTTTTTTMHIVMNYGEQKDSFSFRRGIWVTSLLR